MRKILCLAVFMLALLMQSCSKSYQGLPDLPAKDWLKPDKPSKSPKSEKYEFYSPDKTMTFNDLVWLAIQQSPVISKGRIDLEIQEIDKTSANWHYLPQIHLNYFITMNMTKYNKGTEYDRNNYGETTYETTFSGRYINPVNTYFSTVAAEEMLQAAIVAQRKLIGKVIYNIASTLLDIGHIEKSILLLEKQLADTGQGSEYREVVARHVRDVERSDLLARDQVKSLELDLREKKMELTIARTHLKNLVGLSFKDALKIDADSVLPLINDFNPQKYDWQEGWMQTEDRYMAKQRIRLEQANIFLAWASYLPDFGLNVNESPGKGQSQSRYMKTDKFLHIYLSFPILDWGERWRNADKAEARKRQRMLDEIESERAYNEGWLKHEQELMLAEAKVERAEHAVSSEGHRLESAETAFKSGSVGMDRVIERKRQQTTAKTAELREKYNLYQAKLDFIQFMSGLTRHFLGMAGYQKDNK